MKKLLFVLSLIVVSNVVNAKVSCEEANGYILTGADGKTQYCLSKPNMSWWSAFAWCDAIENASMFDITIECNKKLADRGACPQIGRATGVPSRDEKGGWTVVWMKNTPTNDKAYHMMLSGGDPSLVYISSRTEKASSLCVLGR